MVFCSLELIFGHNYSIRLPSRTHLHTNGRITRNDEIEVHMHILILCLSPESLVLMLSSIPNMNESCRRHLASLFILLSFLKCCTKVSALRSLMLHFSMCIYVYKHAYNWHNICSLTKQSRFMTLSWPAAANYIRNGSWLHETSLALTIHMYCHM